MTTFTTGFDRALNESTSGYVKGRINQSGELLPHSLSLSDFQVILLSFP